MAPKGAVFWFKAFFLTGLEVLLSHSWGARSSRLARQLFWGVLAPWNVLYICQVLLPWSFGPGTLVKILSFRDDMVNDLSAACRSTCCEEEIDLSQPPWTLVKLKLRVVCQSWVVILWNKNSEVFIPFSAYRSINLPCALLFLFKIPRALLYKGLSVPLIPRSVPVRLKNSYNF